MEALDRFREEVRALAAPRPGDLELPIGERQGLTRGALLDSATSVLELYGYRLDKVRVEGARWIAHYRPARLSGEN